MRIGQRNVSVGALGLLLAVGLLVPAVGWAQVPQNLSATAGDEEVSLSWERPELDSDEVVVCYPVYRDTTSLPDTNPEDVSDKRIDAAEPPESGPPSFTDTEVVNGVTYFYRVTAETAEEEDLPVPCGGEDANESSFSNEGSATPFAPVMLRVVAPSVPVSDPVEAGTDVQVEVEGTNVPSEEPVELRFRRGGGTSFTSVSMESSGTTFTATIPAGQLTERGVEFFVRTRNPQGDVVRTPTEGTSSVRVEVQDLSFTQPSGTAQTAYRMVSFPTAVEDGSLESLFEEDLGPADPNEWRLFSISEDGFTASSGGYVERTDLGAPLEVGRGIWLISRDGGTPTAEEGTTIRTDEPFRVPLREGWNLVGNPFAFEVPVSQLRIENSAGTLQDLFSYNGTFVPKTDGDVLEPFRGYLVRLSDGQAGTLAIDPSREDTRAVAQSGGSPSPTWHVNVSARIGRARDTHNAFGVAPGAAPGIDRQDGREPPPIGKYVSLSFRPLGNEEAVLWRDIRAPEASLMTWIADIETNASGTVTLRASGVDSVPADLDVWLFDPALETAQDLRDAPQYRFPASEQGGERRLRFLVGPPVAVQEALGRKQTAPKQVELLPSAPNPVRESATLRYKVPSTMQVSLRLYDLLGRRVATFVNGERVRAGTHTHVWDGRAGGRSLSSGTYFLRLRAGDVTQTRRLVVVQ